MPASDGEVIGDGMILTHSLPPQTRERVRRSMRVLEQFPDRPAAQGALAVQSSALQALSAVPAGQQ